MQKPTSVARGWHVADGNRGLMFRRDADFRRYGRTAPLFKPFDVTKESIGFTQTARFVDGVREIIIVTTSTNEFVCKIVWTGKHRRHVKWVLADGRTARRQLKGWVDAGNEALAVLRKEDPNIGLPLPARVY